MPAGRPTSYTESKFNYIVEQIEAGRSVNSICAESDMPNRNVFYAWLDSNPELQNKYARACEQRADAIFDEMEAIIRSTPADRDEIAKTRLLVDTQKWQLSKMNPKKYGDKIQQEITGNSIKVTFGEE